MTYHLAKYTFSDNFNQFNEHRIITVTFNNGLICLYTYNKSDYSKYVRVYRQQPGSDVNYTLIFAIEIIRKFKFHLMERINTMHVLPADENPNIYHIIASNNLKLIAGLTILTTDGKPDVIDIFTSLNPDNKLFSYISKIYYIGPYIYVIAHMDNISKLIKAHVTHRNPGGQKLRPKDKPLKWSVVVESLCSSFAVGFVNQNIICKFKDSFHDGVRAVSKYVLNTIDGSVTYSEYDEHYKFKYGGSYYDTHIHASHSLYDGSFMICNNYIINGESIGTTVKAHRNFEYHKQQFDSRTNTYWIIPELYWAKVDGSCHIITILSALTFTHLTSFSFLAPTIMCLTYDKGITTVDMLYHFDPDALTITPIIFLNKNTRTNTYQNQTCLLANDTLYLLSRVPRIEKADIYTWLEPLLPYELCEIIYEYYQPEELPAVF